MPELLNWELLKNPYNWVIVALMLAIAAFGLHLVMGEGPGVQHATGSAGQ
jgi:ABC-type arginine/histidine transport system permease subunit